MVSSSDEQIFVTSLFSSLLKIGFVLKPKDRKRLKEIGVEFSFGIISNRKDIVDGWYSTKIYCFSQKIRKPPIENMDPLELYILLTGFCKLHGQFSLSRRRI